MEEMEDQKGTQRAEQYHAVHQLKRKLSEMGQERILLKQKLDERTKEFEDHQKQLDLLLRSYSLDATINHHDFIPIKRRGRLWVAMSMAGRMHFPYDSQYNPCGKFVGETIQHLPCLKNKKTISVDKIEWLDLNRAAKKSRKDRCVNCTPNWVHTNWEFAKSCGSKEGWHRWQRRDSTDHLYHADTCDILNVDDNDEFVRVDEEAVFKNDGSSQWKPCLLCHKRQFWTEAIVPGDASPSY